MPRTIRLFMWGYQHTFAIRLKVLANEVLEAIGAAAAAEVLLVGVRRPGSQAPHDVCVEPETARWPTALFDGLADDVEAALPSHTLSQMLFGDEAARRDQPEWARQAVVTEEVLKRLEPFDRSNGVVSFALTPGAVDDYDVAVVIQVRQAVLDGHAELDSLTYEDEPYKLSLIRACIQEVLDAARSELVRPDPGRGRHNDMRTADEIVVRGARRFLFQVVAKIDRSYIGDTLYDQLCELSALPYEGGDGRGLLAIMPPGAERAFDLLNLRDPVPLKGSRWARKLLQLATSGYALLATPKRILGVGPLPVEPSIVVDFHGQQRWNVRLEDQPLLTVERGRPTLPQEPIPQQRFDENVARLFPETTSAQRGQLWEVFRLQARQPHGSLVVVAEDAAAEADRLFPQATRIEPTLVTNELLLAASQIDGALLLDPTGVCVAIGVILDGQAHEACLASRGGRYNSAVRYVHASGSRRMAIVHSDDGSIDVLPLLRPRVSRDALAAAIEGLKTAPLGQQHVPRNYLDEHRFYLSETQCRVVNAALERLDDEARLAGELRFQIPEFVPDKEMDDSYLV